MPAAENRAILERYITEVWDNQNLESIDKFLSSDYKQHRSATSEPLT